MVGLTEVSNKKMTNHLFGPPKRNEVVNETRKRGGECSNVLATSLFALITRI